MSTQTLEEIMAQAKIDREAEKARADQEKAAKAEQSAQRKAEQEAKKAEREKLKAEREAKKTEKQPEQNGVRRPRPDSLCGAAWAVMDEVTLTNGRMCTIAEVIERAQQLNPSVNINNLRGEFVRWKRFNGVI
jgi:sRNA-binding protein